jgi:hypothetical protein
MKLKKEMDELFVEHEEINKDSTSNWHQSSIKCGISRP